MAWFKLAYRLRLPLQECQESTTSSEFVEWLVFSGMEEGEWHNESRLEFYLAQISAEIRRVREMFRDPPHSVSVEDCMLKFEDKNQQVSPQDKPIQPVSNKGGIETGPDAIKDPKWAKVNANAKHAWAARLGLRELE